MIREETNLTIDYLKEMQEEYIEGEGYERHPLPEWYALDKAIEILEQTTWIPCSERLPDHNVDVLVYDYSDIFVAWYSGIDGNWCSADRRFDKYTPIIAWMPLPDPYEPQEREGKE